MKVSDFDFEIDEGLIADAPMSNRGDARLLLVPSMEGRHIRDLPDILPTGALLIMNDTKVIPARLFGLLDGKEFEVLLHKNISIDRWLAYIRNSKKLEPGNILDFGEMKAEVQDKSEEGVELLFNVKGAELFAAIDKVGKIPLPPYIKRPANEHDIVNYQTIYARSKGAVAAPTAGLHIDNDLLARFQERGIETAFITLHVGAGTFQPVKADDTEDHIMHAEYGVLYPKTADVINRAKREKRPIVAIGTTSLRLLESAVGMDGVVRDFVGETSIFITPGYKFKVADMLLTNFHLPKSTLFMLACAFAGTDEMKRAYELAMQEKYRLYSYGDATLLWKKD